MNKFLAISSAAIASLLSFAASAAPGEYWEVTTKMEMPGMPFAMPGTTTKVCIAKGGEKDPGKSTGDKNCQATDVKTVGNKTSWKVRCAHDGEVMTGSGEQTTSANGYDGKMQFSSSSQKRGGNMTMVFSGKRVGGNCDSEEQQRAVKKEADRMAAQGNAMQAEGKKAMDKQCDLSGKDSFERIRDKLWFIGQKPLCSGKSKEFCNLIRKDAASDMETYDALVADEKMSDQIRQEHKKEIISIVKECNLSMPASLKAICKTINTKNYSQFIKHCPAEAKAFCKTINGKNYDQLAGYCPAEAKSFREKHRHEYCEGREYTAETRAEDIKRCLGGENLDPENEDGRSGNNESAPEDSGNSSNSNPAADMLEGAKKLKGMFGF